MCQRQAVGSQIASTFTLWAIYLTLDYFLTIVFFLKKLQASTHLCLPPTQEYRDPLATTSETLLSIKF